MIAMITHFTLSGIFFVFSFFFLSMLIWEFSFLTIVGDCMHGLYGIFSASSTCQQALVMHLYGCLRMIMDDFMDRILHLGATNFIDGEFFYNRRHSTDIRLMGYACHGREWGCTGTGIGMITPL